ncbi:MAG: P-II family nitrogen regulator [Gammaproteobacteria bacterium]|nr:P-II family nitrogen regulator [Gammaproteobacteria bacterium]MDH5727829.1 P-II family nitrogen regulator [Gammaproteobacteria bacterium]
MHFKLIIALVPDDRTEDVMDAARKEGATGATVINHARGEGLEPVKTFFGLSLETQRDMILFLVEEHLSRKILEKIELVASMDENSGAGIAFQINVEDAVGVSHQVSALSKLVEDEL